MRLCSKTMWNSCGRVDYFQRGTGLLTRKWHWCEFVIVETNHHSGNSELLVIVGVAVLVVAAPTSTEAPHTPHCTKSLSLLTLSYQNVCQITRESQGWEAELASTTAGARCTGKHGGPEALIKTAMTPPRRTHVHTLSVSVVHAKSSLGLSTSGSGIHLRALLLALL